MKRREFIKRSAVAGAVAGFPTIIPSSVLGNNDNIAPSNKVAIGIIGCGSRAKYAGMYKRYDRSEVVAVSDPFKDRRETFSKEFNNCAAHNDFRDLLERKDVDAVHIATPDHWHVPISMLAAKAGKDMYTEKPLGISIDQDLHSRKIVDKYNRVFQYGAQQRSIMHVRLGIELVLNGHIGEVKEIYAWASPGRSGGNPAEQPIPEGLDYNMWIGPADMKPYCSDRVSNQGAFHCYDYAIGFIAGWGAHPMDMLQWWADNAGMKEIPVKYEGTGKWSSDDLYNATSHWDVNCTYANGMNLRFMDSQAASKAKPHPAIEGAHGTLFVGEKGWVRVSRGGWATSSEEIRRKARNVGEKRLKISKDHIQNFVDCMISRETPVDDLHSAVRSDVATHLSNIALRTGKTVEWDPKKERIKEKQLRHYMEREMREPWKI